MNRCTRAISLALLPLALVLAAGCSDESANATVNGTVTLDGRPLAAGVVRFVPADGKSQTATAEVKDGKFSAVVPVGEMRVEFSAPKVVGKLKMYDTPDSPFVDESVEALPERYNIKSELRITVRKGSQDETFALAGK